MRKVCLFAGVFAFAMAVLEAVNPTQNILSGRWGWLKRPFFELFGQSGLAALWILAGVVLIAVGLVRRS